MELQTVTALDSNSLIAIDVEYRRDASEAITTAEYRAFQDAYDFFNRALFSCSLPHVLVTFQRHANTRGYFAPYRFSGRTKDAAVHELALNPDSFTDRTDEEILSTLVHEMVHVWQQTHGRPPRRSYHDKQWAAKMKEVGLQPTDTGLPGGNETGQRITHYIIEGGRFASAHATLQATGLQLNWQSASIAGNASATRHAKAKRASKTKFSCVCCGQNAWQSLTPGSFAAAAISTREYPRCLRSCSSPRGDRSLQPPFFTNHMAAYSQGRGCVVASQCCSPT